MLNPQINAQFDTLSLVDTIDNYLKSFNVSQIRSQESQNFDLKSELKYLKHLKKGIQFYVSTIKAEPDPLIFESVQLVEWEKKAHVEYNQKIKIYEQEIEKIINRIKQYEDDFKTSGISSSISEKNRKALRKLKKEIDTFQKVNLEIESFSENDITFNETVPLEKKIKLIIEDIEQLKKAIKKEKNQIESELKCIETLSKAKWPRLANVKGKINRSQQTILQSEKDIIWQEKLKTHYEAQLIKLNQQLDQSQFPHHNSDKKPKKTVRFDFTNLFKQWATDSSLSEPLMTEKPTILVDREQCQSTSSSFALSSTSQGSHQSSLDSHRQAASSSSEFSAYHSSHKKGNQKTEKERLKKEESSQIKEEKQIQDSSGMNDYYAQNS